ncbi:S8 family serine peptidase [Longimicrobium sp.]|uniref:S8 family serine peptidase n=1 Tax=Longimicrobium sp. TaxID=2029185 RepID=UPI002C08F96C|nr:S8 family serine peptidase [Longimicrobium sp.]HSU12479.1 S8 family serine peptidase [Longimicrobium sp.]
MYALVDREREAMLGGLRVVARYPAFVLVSGDELPAGLPAGEVEVLGDETISVHGEPVRIAGGVFETGDAPHVLVRFVGPVTGEWKGELAAKSVEVLFWCPRFGACVALPEGMDGAALQAAFPFIAGAQPYLEEHCSRGLEEQSGSRTVSPPDLYDLVCFSKEDRARVAEELKGMGIEVLDASSSKIRVRFQGDPQVLRDIVGVKIVDPARVPVTLQTAAAAAPATTAGALGLAGGEAAGLTGRGQVIAVADTGLDTGAADASLHPDFRGRVRFLRSWPVNPSWSPFVKTPGADDGPADRNSGHGTHVAGLALGGGALEGAHRGVAPEAELVFQSLEQYTDVATAYASRIPTGYYLSGRPLDLRELFREARAQGARIHVNSWGDPAQGRYTDDCFEADLFLRENPDAVVLFAAGNDGCDRDGDRLRDAGSLYAPATAKNVVTIGATEGAASGVGVRGSWGDMDPAFDRYRSTADRADAVSGDPTQLAQFSSAGPTADGRIKPDVCAPGTNLVAPRSQRCRGNGWGLASPLPYYMYFGGTSMANGVAGGFAALVRQAWEAELGQAPGGAALKALLVHGARPVLRRDGKGPEPRTAAGFGRLHFDGCAPRQADRTVKLVEDAPGLGSGELREYRFTLRRAGTVRAVLAWYDAPGERLVNDLDLTLSGPAGKVWGNHPAGQAGAPDRANTVEVVHLDDAAPGEYVLRVTGANVPAGPQPFALVYTHPASPAVIELPVDFISGIGAAAAKKLAAAGAATVGALQRMGDDEIAAHTGLRGKKLETLRGRLAALESAAARRPAAGLPPSLTLAQVGAPAAPPPAGVAPEAWTRAAAELRPLAEVFDRTRLGRIRLADLFGAAG